MKKVEKEALVLGYSEDPSSCLFIRLFVFKLDFNYIFIYSFYVHVYVYVYV